MAASADRLVWIDCEMTGLNPEHDELVEIAVIVTDFELEPLHPGLDLVIKPSDAAREGMGDFVREMHAASGLLDELDAGLSLEEAQSTVVEYVRGLIPGEQRAAIAGNTIGTDRVFISRFLPELDALLHYRSVDVSSIKELARRWFPRAYFNAPSKNGGHRALADIQESIRELAYYRKAVFRDEPGLTSAELGELSATFGAAAVAEPPAQV